MNNAMVQEQYRMLSAFKERAFQTLKYNNQPTKKQEEWRYSDFTLLESDDNKINVTNDSVPLILDDKNYHIVLINGVLDQTRLNLPKKGIQLYDAGDKVFLDEFAKFDLQNGFDNKFHILQNYSQMMCGILIDISVTLDKPLKIYYCNNEHHNCTIFIKVRKGVNIKLYEKFIQYGNARNFLNQVTKVELDDHAHCAHFKQHHFTNDVQFLYSSKVVCKASAQYYNYVLNVGCKSYRQDVECELRGERASCNFYGVDIGKVQQRYDVILNVKHQNSHTSSVQHYNQILADKSQGSFYSKVEIPELLNSIEAHQLNKNLLLDETAQVFSRPEFDIHSDDVCCSHGATVGHIDMNAIDYLKSRGIDHIEAQKLILQGFVKTVFEDKGLDKEDYEMLVCQIMDHIK